jgi:hypothetical protein
MPRNGHAFNSAGRVLAHTERLTFSGKCSVLAAILEGAILAHTARPRKVLPPKNWRGRARVPARVARKVFRGEGRNVRGVRRELGRHLGCDVREGLGQVFRLGRISQDVEQAGVDRGAHGTARRNAQPVG